MAGETTVAEFDEAFTRARCRVERNGAATLAEEQAALGELEAGLSKDEDRQWAARMIESLAVPKAAAPVPSALLLEAAAVQRAALSSDGSDEERIAALAEARHKIFEIARKASTREAPQIRGLARVLEHLEDGLDDPFWELDNLPPQPSDSPKSPQS